MRSVQFRRILNEDNALRVRFELERGIILKFMIQLECRFEDDARWIPVVRYDTAHGFAHCDILHPHEAPTKIELPSQNYNEALTSAMDDLVDHWDAYRRRYERWLKQK